MSLRRLLQTSKMSHSAPFLTRDQQRCQYASALIATSALHSRLCYHIAGRAIFKEICFVSIIDAFSHCVWFMYMSLQGSRLLRQQTTEFSCSESHSFFWST